MNVTCCHQEKRVMLPSDDPTPYASEGLSLFSFSHNNLQHLATLIMSGKRR